MGSTVMPTSEASVTVSDAVPVCPEKLAVIVVVPGVAPVLKPALSMDAIELLADDQVASLVMSVVLPLALTAIA